MLTDRKKDEMKKRYAALQDGSEVYLVLRMDTEQPDTVWGTACRNLVRELAENLRGMMVLRVDLSDEERTYLGQMAKEFSAMCRQLDGEGQREKDLDEIRLLEERLHDLKTRLTDGDEPEEEDHEEITTLAHEEFEKELKEEEAEEEEESAFAKKYAAYKEEFFSASNKVMEQARAVQANFESQFLRSAMFGTWDDKFVTSMHSAKTFGMAYSHNDRTYKTSDGRII